MECIKHEVETYNFGYFTPEIEEEYDKFNEYYKISRTDDKVDGYLPDVDTDNHTMAGSLDLYCSQRIPGDLIQTFFQENNPIEIHGVLHTDIEEVLVKKGYSNVQKIDFHHNPSLKRYNNIRPAYYTAINLNGKNTLICAITPGRDYIYHYYHVIKYFIEKVCSSDYSNLKCIRYPIAEIKLDELTELDDKFVSQDDTVILGYVDQVSNEFRNKDLEPIETVDSDYYGAEKYEINGKNIVCLGVKFSFWGNISAKIVKRVAKLGAKEIIYTAKLGCLTTPDDIYERIFTPDTFINASNNKFGKIFRLPNKLAEFHSLNTSNHLSIPTILEETVEQRRIANRYRVGSIDNEIAIMALSLKEIMDSYATNSSETKRQINFSSMHLATDYLRTAEEIDDETPHDLSNSRTQEAKQKRDNLLSDMTDKVYNYLNN